MMEEIKYLLIIIALLLLGILVTLILQGVQQQTHHGYRRIDVDRIKKELIDINFCLTHIVSKIPIKEQRRRRTNEKNNIQRQKSE